MFTIDRDTVVYVVDVATTVSWYAEKLGCKPVVCLERSASFKFAGGDLVLAKTEEPIAPSCTVLGAADLSFLNLDDPDHPIIRFVAGRNVVTLRDPSGNFVVLLSNPRLDG